VGDTAHARGRDRGAGQRAQKHAPQRVPKGRAVSGRERLAGKFRVTLVAFDALDLGVLKLY